MIARSSIGAARADAGPLGNATSPAPSLKHWIIGGGLAVAAHVIGALPFLPAPVELDDAPVVEQGTEIGVNLAPLVRPPEQTTPPPEPEPEPEVPTIQERASDSPPPAPPAKPREIPDLPDIQPRAVPELWLGNGGAGDAGQLSLEEYLFLQDWLQAARAEVLDRLVYPPEAMNAFITGTARVVVVADRDGRVVSWRFLQSTGSNLLDRAIERSIRGIRRLPRFPEGTRYDTLSYVVMIRFELVRPDGTIMAATDVQQAAAQRAAQLPQEFVSAAHIAQCAGTAAQLTTERAAIEAELAAIEAMRSQYEEQAERYIRRRQPAPRSLERLLEDYNARVAGYDALVTRFQQRASGYKSLCSGGSTSYEEYATACEPYVATGNEYCAAFGNFWARLRSQ